MIPCHRVKSNKLNHSSPVWLTKVLPLVEIFVPSWVSNEITNNEQYLNPIYSLGYSCSKLNPIQSFFSYFLPMRLIKPHILALSIFRMWLAILVPCRVTPYYFLQYFCFWTFWLGRFCNCLLFKDIIESFLYCCWSQY